MTGKKGWVWFDMDGTIADLYGVEGWLDDLIAHKTRPYNIAPDIYNEDDLLNIIIDLKNKGYNVGVISWGSKDKNDIYLKAVEQAKIEWLYKRSLTELLDKIIVTAYGIKKADTCRKYGKGILVDDEKQNRKAWDLGETIDATKNIIEELRRLV